MCVRFSLKAANVIHKFHLNARALREQFIYNKYGRAIHGFDFYWALFIHNLREKHGASKQCKHLMQYLTNKANGILILFNGFAQVTLAISGLEQSIFYLKICSFYRWSICVFYWNMPKWTENGHVWSQNQSVGSLK